MTKSGTAGLAFTGATGVALAFAATQTLAAPGKAEPAGARACTDKYCTTVVCYPFPGVCRGGKCLCAG